MHDSIRAHSAAIHWFRKGLRLHDNPALIEACRSSSRIFPVFCIDPYFAKPDIIGVNRYSFLLESLHDLDLSLRDLGSRLFVVKGHIVILATSWYLKTFIMLPIRETRRSTSITGTALEHQLAHF